MAIFHPPIDRRVDVHRSVLCLVIDRSGSMHAMLEQVHTSINRYLHQQQLTDSAANLQTTVILITFDDQLEIVWRGLDLTTNLRVVAADVEPRNSTALYDAIALGLQTTCDFVIGHMFQNPAKVIILILTDGLENASQHWSQNQIAEEIKHLNSAPYNWEFYFAAANQDAVFSGLQLNVPAEQCITFAGREGMQNAFEATGKAHTRMRRGLPKGYTEQERASAINTNEL